MKKFRQEIKTLLDNQKTAGEKITAFQRNTKYVDGGVTLSVHNIGGGTISPTFTLVTQGVGSNGMSGSFHISSENLESLKNILNSIK